MVDVRGLRCPGHVGGVLQVSYRILLTGGSGFIGHHVVEHLLKNTTWDVVVLDKLSYAGDVNKLTDVGSYDPARVSIVWHDLRAPIMDSLVERIGPVDYVVNLASESHVERSIEDPNSFVMNNVALMLNMLDYANKAEPVKFIQLSTDEVYGPAPLGYDFKEWDTYLPSNPYSASKAAQESIAISYWRTYGTPVAIVNSMNVFGERQHSEKFIPLIIGRLMNGVQVPVHAELANYGPAGAAMLLGEKYTSTPRPPDGWERRWVPGSRFWLHARNLASALMFVLQDVEFNTYPDHDRPTKFHVVGEQELNNLQVVQKVASILGVEPKYEFVDFHSQRPGHDRRYALDGSLIRSAGWYPPFGFDESLRKTVLWTVEHQNAQVVKG